MTDINLIRINFKGGLVSPSTFKSLMLELKKLGILKVRFGLRQQLLLDIPSQMSVSCIESIKKTGLYYQVNENTHPNIISSYAGEEIFQQGNWFTEGIYKDILDAFDYEPTLKINISDNNQSLSPYFSGHLNFIASNIPNFWYFSLRFPKSNQVKAYSKLLYTNDIPQVCKLVEDQIASGNFSFNKLWESIPPSIMQTSPDAPLKLFTFRLPYYEGLNRYGKKSWLGVYRRDEQFSIDFLIELCDLCLKTKIGQFCLTPWKSIIVKGIEEKSRLYWSNLLAKHGINVRHAAVELNWQIEDEALESLQLKNRLVKYFEKWDLRTFGICFGIKTLPKTEMFASIMVTERRHKVFGVIPAWKVYDISYTKDFDPNGRTKEYLSKDILSFNLPEQLRRSVMFYNNKLIENSIEKVGNLVSEKEETAKKPLPVSVHQCNACFTIYDPTFGDILNGIEPGVDFDKLPETYTCPTCEGSKSQFKSIAIEYQL
ncbi:MAG: rubredoxin [Leadbetterella sp.]